MTEDPPHGEQAWEERYRSSERTWSGNPNLTLVHQVSDLRPGSALDAGAGEGGDAIWLAEQGWRVTATDISTTALTRGAAEATRRGLDIEWLHLDLTVATAPATYDLVSTFYLHLPRAERTMAFAHLAAAVNPGGLLLVVGHDFTDLQSGVYRPGLAEMGWTVDEVVDSLGSGWTVLVAETRARPALTHERAADAEAQLTAQADHDHDAHGSEHDHGPGSEHDDHGPGSGHDHGPGHVNDAVVLARRS